MAEKYKQMKKPIEKQNTAAWANAKKAKKASNVTKPEKRQTRNAKDYVDANQK